MEIVSNLEILKKSSLSETDFNQLKETQDGLLTF